MDEDEFEYDEEWQKPSRKIQKMDLAVLGLHLANWHRGRAV